MQHGWTENMSIAILSRQGPGDNKSTGDNHSLRGEIQGSAEGHCGEDDRLMGEGL